MIVNISKRRDEIFAYNGRDIHQEAGKRNVGIRKDLNVFSINEQFIQKKSH